MEEWIKEMNGKKVYLILKSGRKYSGVVKEVTDNFVFLLDRYNEKVVAAISDISSMEEEK